MNTYGTDGKYAALAITIAFLSPLCLGCRFFEIKPSGEVE
jgi:hypothetical protein